MKFSVWHLERAWYVLRSKVRHFWLMQVSTRINPRQAWLTKKVGRTWVDKDWLLETCVFESMIHFWEDEEGEKIIRYQFECIEDPCFRKAAKPEDQERYQACKAVYFELRDCYNWARVREQAWAEFNESGYDPTYIQREEALIEKDTRRMQDIIRLRKWMWT